MLGLDNKQNKRIADGLDWIVAVVKAAIKGIGPLFRLIADWWDKLLPPDPPVT